VETSLSRPPASFDLLRSTHLDETRALVAGVFCDHQLDLIRREPLDYVHLHGQIGRIGFSVMSYGAEVQITPGPLKSFFLVQMPLEGHDLIRIGKESLHSDTNHASVHSPDDSLGMQWSKDCRKMVVRFDREALERHAQSMTGTPVRPGGLKLQPVMDARKGAGQAWIRTARHVLDELRASPALLASPLICAQFEQLMMTTLLEWQPGSVSESLQRDSREVLPRHVRLVEDYIRAHPEQPITIEQLTEMAGVSGRTLYSGFQKFRGVSPMRYLRDVRMERVRSDLLDPSQARSVTELATRWGFFQLGRFATEYRKRYGECPGDTLRRAV